VFISWISLSQIVWNYQNQIIILGKQSKRNINWEEFLSMASSFSLVVKAEDLWLRGLCFKPLLMSLFIMLYLLGSKSTSKMINVTFPTYLTLMYVLWCNNNGSIFKAIRSSQINTNWSLEVFIQFKMCKNLLNSGSKSKTWPIKMLSCIWYLI